MPMIKEIDGKKIQLSRKAKGLSGAAKTAAIGQRTVQVDEKLVPGMVVKKVGRRYVIAKGKQTSSKMTTLGEVASAIATGRPFDVPAEKVEEDSQTPVAA